MSEWLKEADCKSVAILLRWFESNPAQLTFLNLKTYRYNPTIFLITIESIAMKIKIVKKSTNRSFGILSKFLKGVKITRIKPIKLLIKKRG